MSYDPTQVAFVDTETTGLDPDDDRVWEIAVIVDGEEHVWQQYIGPKADLVNWVNPWVLENTGILDRYDDAICFAATDSIDRLIGLVDGRHLIGACPWFDSERLHRTQRLLTVALRPEPDERGSGVPFGWGRDLRWHYHLQDVETLAVGFIAGLQVGSRQLVWDRGGTIIGTTVTDFDPTFEPWSPSLPWRSEDLSKALGVDPNDFQPKHSALADARWAKAVYERIMGGPR